MLGGHILIGLAGVVEMILNMIQITIFASVIVSWLNAPANNQIVAMIRAVTEPMYRPLRKYTSKIPGPLDWAPMILLFFIMFLMMSIVPWLRGLGYAAK